MPNDLYCLYTWIYEELIPIADGVGCLYINFSKALDQLNNLATQEYYDKIKVKLDLVRVSPIDADQGYAIVNLTNGDITYYVAEIN